MNRTLAIAALLAAAIGAAGCGGGGDPDEFAEKLVEATAPLEQLSGDPGNVGLKRAGRKYGALAASFDEVKERLAALEPPDAAQDELDAYVTALGKTADQFRELGKAAKADDLEAFATALAGLETVGSSWVDAEDELNIAVAAAGS